MNNKTQNNKSWIDEYHLGVRYGLEGKVLINEQYIGVLKGLKFNIELTSKTLDTDIKSIKKAARKGIAEELSKRVQKIICMTFGY